jgi:hypothetical protein
VRVPHLRIQELIQTSLESRSAIDPIEPDMKLGITFSMGDDEYELIQERAEQSWEAPAKLGMTLEIDGVNYNLMELKNYEEKPVIENGMAIKLDGRHFFVHERQKRNSFVELKSFNKWEAPLDLGLSLEFDGKKFNLVQADSSMTFVPAEHLGMTVEIDGRKYELMQISHNGSGDDLGMVISMDGQKFQLAEKKEAQTLAQQKFEPPMNLGMTIEIDGKPYKLAQGDHDSDMGMTITIDGKKYQINQMAQTASKWVPAENLDMVLEIDGKKYTLAERQKM